MVAPCSCRLPVNLFFLKDQVNQEDQEDPKTDTDGQKSERRECGRDSEGRARKKERRSMLMASNNMQFTVQASAMMSMCYIYVSAIRFKGSFSAESTNQKTLGWEPFGKDKNSPFGVSQSINTVLHLRKALNKTFTARLCDAICRTGLGF